MDVSSRPSPQTSFYDHSQKVIGKHILHLNPTTYNTLEQIWAKWETKYFVKRVQENSFWKMEENKFPNFSFPSGASTVS